MRDMLKHILSLAAKADAAGLTKEAATLDKAATIIEKFALDPNAEFNKALTAITQSGQPISQEQMIALRDHYLGPNAKPSNQPIKLPTQDQKAQKLPTPQAKPNSQTKKTPKVPNPKIQKIQIFLEQARQALNQFAASWGRDENGDLQYPAGAKPEKPAVLQVPIAADGFWGPKTDDFIKYGLNLVRGQHYNTLDQLLVAVQGRTNAIQERVKRQEGNQPSNATPAYSGHETHNAPKDSLQDRLKGGNPLARKNREMNPTNVDINSGLPKE